MPLRAVVGSVCAKIVVYTVCAFGDVHETRACAADAHQHLNQPHNPMSSSALGQQGRAHHALGASHCWPVLLSVVATPGVTCGCHSPHEVSKDVLYS